MTVNIKTVHFSISEQLESFTQKKVSKAIAKFDDVVTVDIIMKLVKPETQENKEVEIRVTVPGVEMFAKKVADSFEESVTIGLDAVVRQLKRHKEKIQK